MINIAGIMATSTSQPKGYQCVFIDSVPGDFYCKKCILVARNISLTSCCTENFCQTCIADIQEQGEPCPECGTQQFTVLSHVKNQKQINLLKLYCSMKERGCDWSGTLDQLDTHLDPHLDNCQYVDTKCPLNCLQTIPKNKVDQHVAQECTKRPHVCQHCGFKATYEEVVDTHLPECKYVPLQCPNMCGVSCEREVMEDHMKICRLEEVECEFSSVGCDGRFIREDQDEHTRQNSQKHLTLTASLAVETKEQLQQKLLEQDRKHKEVEEKLKNKIEEQDRKLAEQQLLLNEQKETLKREQELRQIVMKLSRMMLQRRFEMKDFEKIKSQNIEWKSPAMYTHVGGYKFCIGVDAYGFGEGKGNSIDVDVYCMLSEFDGELSWPVDVTISVELINQQGRENASCTETFELEKPVLLYHRVGSLRRIPTGFLKHSELDSFLDNDTLFFYVSHIQLSPKPLF